MRKITEIKVKFMEMLSRLKLQLVVRLRQLGYTCRIKIPDPELHVKFGYMKCWSRFVTTAVFIFFLDSDVSVVDDYRVCSSILPSLHGIIQVFCTRA